MRARLRIDEHTPIVSTLRFAQSKMYSVEVPSVDCPELSFDLQLVLPELVGPLLYVWHRTDSVPCLEQN